MSIIKEVGLPKRPPQSRNDEVRDLSERVPPPRSSSPVIGSPPVRAVPIGTPPKQPMSHALNHQVNNPKSQVLRKGLIIITVCQSRRIFSFVEGNNKKFGNIMLVFLDQFSTCLGILQSHICCIYLTCS